MLFKERLQINPHVYVEGKTKIKILELKACACALTATYCINYMPKHVSHFCSQEWIIFLKDCATLVNKHKLSCKCSSMTCSVPWMLLFMAPSTLKMWSDTIRTLFLKFYSHISIPSPRKVRAFWSSNLLNSQLAGRKLKGLAISNNIKKRELHVILKSTPKMVLSVAVESWAISV